MLLSPARLEGSTASTSCGVKLKKVKENFRAEQKVLDIGAGHNCDIGYGASPLGR
jgi:hypothetical protein